MEISNGDLKMEISKSKHVLYYYYIIYLILYPLL